MIVVYGTISDKMVLIIDRTDGVNPLKTSDCCDNSTTKFNKEPFSSKYFSNSDGFEMSSRSHMDAGKMIQPVTSR